MFFHLAVRSHIETVIIFGTTFISNGKTSADFNTFYRTNGENRCGQHSIQLAKNRLSDSCRHAADYTFNHATNGIMRLHFFCQIIFSKRRLFQIRHAQRTLFNVLQRHLFFLAYKWSNLLCVGSYGNSKLA